MRAFLACTYAILRSTQTFTRQVNIRILQCDDQIRSDTPIRDLDQLKDYMDNFQLTGGSATDFRPVFDHVAKLREEGAFPTCGASFTSPTAWASTPRPGRPMRRPSSCWRSRLCRCGCLPGPSGWCCPVPGLERAVRQAVEDDGLDLGRAASAVNRFPNDEGVTYEHQTGETGDHQHPPGLPGPGRAGELSHPLRPAAAGAADGPPGVGKTQIMEQIAAETGVGLVAYTITHHTRQSAIGLPFIEHRTYGGREVSVTEYTMSEILGSVYRLMEKQGSRRASSSWMRSTASARPWPP